MVIDTKKIVELQKTFELYSTNYEIDNDVRVAFWQANKAISELVGELAKYKSLGDYNTLQRLVDNASNVDKAITNQAVSVWVQERVDDFHIKNERQVTFNSISDAIQFMKGIPSVDYVGKEVSKSEQEEIECVQMDTYFESKKLLKIKEQSTYKEFAASYIGEKIYRVDVDPYMTNDGENYKIKSFPITSVEKYWNNNLVLKSGEEEVCLLENIDTEKPFLDCYICFSSKEKAETHIEGLQHDKDLKER